MNNEGLTDIDQVLLHLEAKEFTVEPSTLQSLHQLIQWVADLALNLLARLPEQRKTVGVSASKILIFIDSLFTFSTWPLIISAYPLIVIFKYTPYYHSSSWATLYLILYANKALQKALWNEWQVLYFILSQIRIVYTRVI